jgi:hypothetical protein
MTHIAIQEKKEGKVVDWMRTSPTNNIGPGNKGDLDEQ